MSSSLPFVESFSGYGSDVDDLSSFSKLSLMEIRSFSDADLFALLSRQHAALLQMPAVAPELHPLSKILSSAREIRTTDTSLAGAPVLIKANIAVAGLRRTCGCTSYAETPCAESAPVVRALEAAGAVVLGHSSMDQFACGLVGTRTADKESPANPSAPSFITGGSSSGSAVAVTGGFACIALGTDTAGSGRVPAAMCGIVGLKPTRGMLSTAGIVPACPSIDCVSVFANCVDDAREVVRCILKWQRENSEEFEAAPYDRLQPFPRDSRLERFLQNEEEILTVAVPGGDALTFHGDIRAEHAFRSGLDALRMHGIRVINIDFAPFTETGNLLYGDAFVAERYSVLGDFIEKTQCDEGKAKSLDAVVTKIILGGKDISAAQAFRALEKVQKNIHRVKKTCWDKAHFLLVPSVPCAFTEEHVKQDPITTNTILGTYTNFVNLLDCCALAVPQPQDDDDVVPRGVTLIAPAFSDAFLAKMAEIVLAAFWESCS